MKVLLTKKFHDGDIRYIQERIYDDVDIIIPPDYSEDTLVDFVSDVDILFGGFISEKLLNVASQLKFIQVPWSGVDNLNFDLLSRYDLVICNSHSNAGIVAEHAVALMMDAAKKLSYHDRLMRSGDWNRLFPGNTNELTPFSKKIAHSHVGFVGYGAISRAIRGYLSGFSCEFTAFNRTGNNNFNDHGVTFHKISSFTSHAHKLDYLFICVPLTDESRNLVDEYFLGSLSNQCILINLSRGAVVDQDALYQSLETGKLAFAAIDTWYQYPNPDNPHVFPSADNDFHKLNNIVLSPHRSGYYDGGLPHLDDAIDNLNRYSTGKSLKNIISLDHKY